ncbi:FABP family protein [Demequina lignilytica]|uniref:Ferric nitrobindin-like protein n=1 Tax=Demequina lignilytica TaxID=3051663 RepID=A0AB35MK93_9MICO|nr:FABP family protein [Demequina sp. SYSU T0a273]MDN4484241.1 FABP family protein [Demequina sp. SYSU T0a273]
MTFVIPSDLAPEVYPLAWVVGTWEGHGVVDYPGIDAADFRQRVVFDHDGGPYLIYSSTITLMGPDGEEGQVWSQESGFWRVAPSAPEGVTLQDFQHPLEVVLADASGLLTAYFGAVGNGRIDLATRFAAATESGPDVRGATRMYGNVGGELMWAWDLAAFGQELQSYASARLSRVEGPEVPDAPEES